MKFYNSLSRKIEDFKPFSNSQVTLYSCGPTVYDYAHIGNLRAYIFVDTLQRSLKYLGYAVKRVINVTDVGHLTSDADIGDDKVEKKAQLEKKSAREIADFYLDAYLKDLKKLNIEIPSLMPKATDYIKEMISLIQVLEKKGYTYITNDGVYFNTLKFPNYHTLSTIDKKGLKKGARVALGQKKTATDFALWKFSPKDKLRQMEWPSPWGKGFPGWHIECSAMSLKLLGSGYRGSTLDPNSVHPIDIHTGAIDHLSVHHPNEIAQSEAATGKKFVNYWLHNEFLVINKSKMAKSQGNFATLNSLIEKGYQPLAYRYFCLTAHYRQQLNFSYQALDSAQKSLKSLYKLVSAISDTQKERAILSKDKQDKIQYYKNQFIESLENDLNIPQALATLWQVLKSSIPSEDKIDIALDFDSVLGLELEKNTLKTKIPDFIKSLVNKRQKLKAENKFSQADKVRLEIEDLGYLVEDSSLGPKIKPIF